MGAAVAWLLALLPAEQVDTGSISPWADVKGKQQQQVPGFYADSA